MDLVSLLATQLGDVHPAPRRRRSFWGIALSASDEETVTVALQSGADPLEALLTEYLQPASRFPHYIVGYDGTIVQICDEKQKAEQVGFDASDRRAFLDGSWKKRLPASAVERWRQQWPDRESPAHLFPGLDPSQVYIGVELLPIVDGVQVQPLSAALRHTFEQHQAVANLGTDIAERLGFPPNWHRSERLVGQEDLNPLQRSMSDPPAGCDPGSLGPSDDRWLDLAWVRQQIDRSLAPARAVA